MSRLDSHSRHPRFLAVAVVSALSLTLIQCDRKASDTSGPVPTEAPEPSPEPAADFVPEPTASLSRSELVSAAGRAASAYAQGQGLTDVDPLVGRRFAVRIPFGCSGPAGTADDAGTDGVARWTWGPDRKTIQLSLTPGDWTGSDWIGHAAPETDVPAWEAVEGFWVPRPWLAAESCPNVPGDPIEMPETPASPQTVGLAAVFEAGSSRVQRRNGRAFVATIRQEGERPIAAPTNGYRLLLTGRVIGFPGGRAIRCRATGPDARPVCVTAVDLDKVAFEDAAGVTLREWRPD